MVRLNISLKNDLVKMLEEEGERKGRTVSSIVSEGASLYLEAEKAGLRSKDILHAFRVMQIMGEIDAVPIPGILLDSMIKLSSGNAEKEVLQRWHERGQVLGNIMKTYARTFNDFSAFVEEYKALFPTDMFDIEIDGNRTTIVLSGVGFSMEASKCTLEGLKGLLSAYGFQSEQEEISQGFVKITAATPAPI